MEHSEISFRNAHANAKHLLDEPFFFSEIDETAPFGSDDGSDAFAGFITWRQTHADENPIKYLHQLFDEWGYPPIDPHGSEPGTLESLIQSHELAVTFLTGTDAAIVAVAFGQLYLEGLIGEELKALAITAVKRQLNEELLVLWDEEYRPVREEQLNKLLNVLHRL